MRGVWDTLSHEPILWCQIVCIKNMLILDRRWCAVDRLIGSIAVSPARACTFTNSLTLWRKLRFKRELPVLWLVEIEKRVVTASALRLWYYMPRYTNPKVTILVIVKSYHFSNCHSCTPVVYVVFSQCFFLSRLLVLSLSTYSPCPWVHFSYDYHVSNSLFSVSQWLCLINYCC